MAQAAPLTKAVGYQVIASWGGGAGLMGGISQPCPVQAVYPPAQITGHFRTPDWVYYRSQTALNRGFPSGMCGPNLVTIGALVTDADGFASMNLVYRILETSMGEARGPFLQPMAKGGVDNWQTTVDVEGIPNVLDHEGWSTWYSFNAIDHLGQHHYNAEWSDIEMSECTLPAATEAPAVR